MGGVWEMGDGDRVEGRQKSQRLRKGDVVRTKVRKPRFL